MMKKQNLDKNWKFFLGNLSPTDETEGWGGAKARAYSFGAAAEDLCDEKWRTVEFISTNICLPVRRAGTQASSMTLRTS
ncbi:MAG: hypothetical protein IJ468_10880 [Lachnospiraceae bacterium]|nr:hypothetical protein [Lachnospiraceae bacterium]